MHNLWIINSWNNMIFIKSKSSKDISWFIINLLKRSQLLRPRVPGNPRSCQNGWTHDLNQYRSLIQSFYLQKAFGQGVRTHHSMVLSVMVRERWINWPFTRYSKLTFLFVWRLVYIVSEVLFPSLMVGRYFVLSWWH